MTEQDKTYDEKATEVRDAPDEGAGDQADPADEQNQTERAEK